MSHIVSSQSCDPQLTGLRYMHEIPELSQAMMLTYTRNGSHFSVHFNPDDMDGSLEQKSSTRFKERDVLEQLNDLSYGEETEEKDSQIKASEVELARLIGEASLPLMKKLAPLPIPDPTALQERIYPPTYTFRVLLEGERLIAEEISDSRLPVKYPPISDTKLQEIRLDETIPVFNPSQILLVGRLQSLVWEVTVDGETMICKLAVNVFGEPVSEELEAYIKIRNAEADKAPKVPELKVHCRGIIKSHTGVIGILISYVPHRHHSLRVVLQLIEDGSIPETEATTSLRVKWAQQIRLSFDQLHDLGLLWRDVKSDNVLIDEDNDTVILDFGGGNTVGWVDPDKYGTLEGDEQGFGKIIKNLGVD